MRQTDRDLLEAAAKAVGAANWVWSDKHAAMIHIYGSEASIWNPLAEDGEALRLAVTLRLDLHWYGGYAYAAGKGLQARCLVSGDPLSAMRIAIVRAAALFANKKDSK
jgi:hypothetical protein